MKINKKFALLVGLVVVLPGCLFKQGSVEADKKSTKKLSLLDSGKGIPLGLKDEGKFYDEQVERYILEEEEALNSELGQFNVDEEMRLARADIDTSSAEWQADAQYDNKNFEPIYFGFDKHSIRPDQEEVLAFDIQQAKEAIKEGAITVAGHSDSHFISEPYNIAKSEKRARQVAGKLQSAGIPEERIKVVGYGDKQRVIDVAGKAEKNRRVEIIKLTETS